MTEPVIARHTLAYVAPEAWPRVVGRQDDRVVVGWAAAGRPAIVRRVAWLRPPASADVDHALPLGLPLPPALGKGRLWLRCPRDAVARTAPPPLLDDAAADAPAHWQATIARLLALEPAIRCFGSLAWQHLTGLPYLGEGSDLDLILPCASEECADGSSAALAEIGAGAPMRVDAELIAAGGAAVHWREWRSGASEVLAKSLDGAHLVSRERLFA
jgi:phosphoribosyl-dephospho-CoA transferase